MVAHIFATHGLIHCTVREIKAACRLPYTRLVELKMIFNFGKTGSGES
jgi:hypothetical protein